MPVIKGSYIAVLDVGHGNCSVLYDNRHTVVVDAGLRSSLLEFLSEQGIRHVETVLVSHADRDHIGGLVALLASQTVTVSHIKLNSDSAKGSQLWDDLVYELSLAAETGDTEVTVGLSRATAGQISCGAMEVEVTGPTRYLASKGAGGRDRRGQRLSSNSVSAVFRVHWNECPLILLAGDMDHLSLRDLQEHRVALSAQTLVFPHHGGKAGGGDERAFARDIAAAVTPYTIIFSIGRGGRFSNPRPEIIEGIREVLGDVRIACTQLSEHCSKHLPEEEQVHLVPVFAQGREARKCCAGSIIIKLGQNGVLPTYPAHQEFISACAPTALCRR